MKSYEASATITADPQSIWAILVDARAYPHWESGIERLEGEVAPGHKLKVVSEANPSRAFALKVTDFQPPQRMTWSGGMPLGLFKGARTFTLSPQGAETTHFRMREEYSGPLLPLIWKSMPDLQPSFEKFAAGLKQRAESNATGPTPV